MDMVNILNFCIKGLSNYQTSNREGKKKNSYNWVLNFLLRGGGLKPFYEIKFLFWLEWVINQIKRPHNCLKINKTNYSLIVKLYLLYVWLL